MSTATIQDEDIKFQRENWEMIRSHVSPIISNLTMDNLQESHRDLFQVNILIGRNIICKNAVDFTLNKQNGRLIPALSALIALLLINTVEETLRTFEQSIEYFASSAPLKFTHTLVFIINFELYLTEIIRSFKFTKSKKPFEKILARLLKVKDLYLLDDVNLIGAFLYPSIFQSKSLLNEIFGTTSVNKIVHNMTKIVLRYLKNFINITNFRSSNSGGESGRIPVIIFFLTTRPFL